MESSHQDKLLGEVDTSMAAYDDLNVQNVDMCCEKPTEVNTKVGAYQMFDRTLPQVPSFQQKMKDEKLSKSWQFKYKYGLETSVLIVEQLPYSNATISPDATRDQLLEGDMQSCGYLQIMVSCSLVAIMCLTECFRDGKEYRKRSRQQGLLNPGSLNLKRGLQHEIWYMNMIK